ncbi:hypothetical protein P872_09835 [Rhodonellum psychrophilum GCM71 = DSM 17998]|uniref:Uncharacterized protein n=1 Tax=Rhodonellum psychrophilum GCM71 = DSM 17998 TaxID=1123057 RepID=U5BXU3_9BACT|nr:hypothetical protein P872_09835 [Rhodonellum psychrophilum GCM71 = DSM 17998]
MDLNLGAKFSFWKFLRDKDFLVPQKTIIAVRGF